MFKSFNKSESQLRFSASLIMHVLLLCLLSISAYLGAYHTVHLVKQGPIHAHIGAHPMLLCLQQYPNYSHSTVLVTQMTSQRTIPVHYCFEALTIGVPANSMLSRTKLLRLQQYPNYGHGTVLVTQTTSQRTIPVH
ncbi:hypothetical protein BYT27DRAFT_7219437, partial [Phlegmacium glaucopus]